MITMATRTNQKERTHQAIVSAAARLVDGGCADPSIDDIAEEALVSRATVYRYFESTGDVLWQVFSDRHMLDAETARPITSDDLTERVLVAEENVNDYLFGDHAGTRAFERVMLDRQVRGLSTKDDRPGRRFGQIDAALAPLESSIGSDDLELVRHALSLAIGSQAMIALLDTGRLDPERAREVTRFACEAIVREAERLADSA